MEEKYLMFTQAFGKPVPLTPKGKLFNTKPATIVLGAIGTMIGIIFIIKIIKDHNAYIAYVQKNEKLIDENELPHSI